MEGETIQADLPASPKLPASMLIPCGGRASGQPTLLTNRAILTAIGYENCPDVGALPQAGTGEGQPNVFRHHVYRALQCERAVGVKVALCAREASCRVCLWNRMKTDAKA
jgi:hypothetical protein